MYQDYEYIGDGKWRRTPPSPEKPYSDYEAGRLLRVMAQALQAAQGWYTRLSGLEGASRADCVEMLQEHAEDLLKATSRLQAELGKPEVSG